MKKVIYTILIGAAITLVGCKKPVDEVPQTVEGRSKADDASGRSEMQRAYDDVETVFNSQEYKDASGMRTTTASLLPCGIVTFSAKNFTIDYNQSGSNCTRYRVLSG